MRDAEKLKAAQRRWRIAHPDRAKARDAKWRAANPERVRERQARWRAAHHERSNELARLSYRRHKERNRAKQNITSRKRFLQHRYDLSLEAYESLLLQQDRKCAICKNPMIRPEVDHDHQSGQVRGLLCRNCNLGLGRFHDNPNWLLAAFAYLTTALRDARNNP